MNLDNFIDKLSKINFNKGLQLFLSSIEEIRLVDNNIYEVDLYKEGDQLFTQVIVVDDNKNIINMSCSCNSKNVCIHKAAALFAVSDYINSIDNNNYYNDIMNNSLKTKTKEELINIIKDMTEDDYIKKAILTIKLLPHTFENYQTVISKLYDEKQTVFEYMIELNNIIYRELSNFNIFELTKFVLWYVMYLVKYLVDDYERNEYLYKDDLIYLSKYESLDYFRLERYVIYLKEEINKIKTKLNLNSYIESIIEEYDNYIDFSKGLIKDLFVSVIPLTNYKDINEIKKIEMEIFR